MLFGILMHWVVLAFRVPFPGYEFGEGNGAEEGDVEIPTEKTSLVSNKGNTTQDVAAADAVASSQKDIPTWMYFFLAIPAVFDLAATALCMMGVSCCIIFFYFMVLTYLLEPL